MDKNEVLRMQGHDELKIACRFCVYCYKGHIGNSSCMKYDRIPNEVYFDNAPCPKFEKGEDLLPYEPQP